MRLLVDRINRSDSLQSQTRFRSLDRVFHQSEITSPLETLSQQCVRFIARSHLFTHANAEQSQARLDDVAGESNKLEPARF